MKKLLSVCAALVLAAAAPVATPAPATSPAPAATAQQGAKPAKAPIEVTADSTLEWNREKLLFIARGNAKAKQATTELYGDTLTAHYVDGGDKGMTITRIDADKDVIVISDTTRATGDKGFYDVSKGYAELTGQALKLVTQTDTVTADEKMTYDSNARIAHAIGNARAVRGDDIIDADTLIARFIIDANGEQVMDEMEATGNVKITTPTEVLTSDKGVYKARTNMATVTGNVKILRGQSTIEGARGQIDLNTNISKMYSDGGARAAGGDGRVRGVFYPE